ncbi:MAG: hypothetical protein NTZ49_05410 [Candidatus Parcubacteria bacterium]|nr:hypothetical protein [Candidatus Parcubacteria bacterium]
MKKILWTICYLCFCASLSCGDSGGGGGGGSGGGGNNNNGDTYDVMILVTGDNNNNGVNDNILDDLLVPYDGTEVIYFAHSAMASIPTTLPLMSWDSNYHAYTQTINNLTANQLRNFWISIEEPDQGDLAGPNDLSPVFGVYIQITDNLDGGICTDLLVHYLPIAEDDHHNILYAAKIEGVDPVLGCIKQLADNRTVVFNTGN